MTQEKPNATGGYEARQSGREAALQALYQMKKIEQSKRLKRVRLADGTEVRCEATKMEDYLQRMRVEPKQLRGAAKKWKSRREC